MKAKKEDISKIKEVFSRLSFKSPYGLELFLPLERETRSVDEFGMEILQSKTESYYGNNLIPGLLFTDKFYDDDVYLTPANKENYSDITLCYVQSTNLFSFNLGEYISLTMQQALSEEDIAFITKFECCAVKFDNSYALDAKFYFETDKK